jgi:hypothetical protein
LFRDFGSRLIQVKQQSTGYPFLKKSFLKNHGYSLNLAQPLTFCEWINHKKIYDRNPLIPITSDKFRVRDYVRKKLGESLAQELLVPLLFCTDSAEGIPIEKISGEFFIKPNHASGLSMLVHPDTDRSMLKSIGRKWLASGYGQHLQEWGYCGIPRKIIGEIVLRDSTGQLPKDFKFYCIHGQIEMIGIFQKTGEKSLACYLDPSLREVGGPMGKDSRMIPIPELPNLEKMMQVARCLSEDFQLVRVDLYSFDEKIYFGEITHYPGSGLDRFDSYDLDLQLGKKITEGIFT